MTPPAAPSADVAAALDALRRGDWSAARARLETLNASGAASADHLALLAFACHKLGDDAAAHGAVDAALKRDGSSVRALLMKADLLNVQGETRGANMYYGAVVKHGEAARDLPADLAHGVRRARTLRDKLVTSMREHLRSELDRAGYSEARSDRRFTHALDLLEGRREVYPQRPRMFYYPELPAIQFFPRDQFPWLDGVEAATETMLGELQALLAEDAAFDPYLKTLPGVPSEDYPLVDSLDWSSCFLWKDGSETAQAARCPGTMAALADAPLCRIPGRSPQIMFSQLKAGAHIRPHTGVVNTRLVCHLPLIVPEGCSFRVGNETRSWRKGEAWVFDDTIEHEARNDGDQTRVVLIFDIWRPELSEEERLLVTTLLQAVDRFSPTADWD